MKARSEDWKRMIAKGALLTGLAASPLVYSCGPASPNRAIDAEVRENSDTTQAETGTAADTMNLNKTPESKAGGTADSGHQ